jgi:hypothetical protein
MTCHTVIENNEILDLTFEGTIFYEKIVLRQMRIIASLLYLMIEYQQWFRSALSEVCAKKLK